MVNDPETFPARETPPAFQAPVAVSPLTQKESQDEVVGWSWEAAAAGVWIFMEEGRKGEGRAAGRKVFTGEKGGSRGRSMEPVPGGGQISPQPTKGLIRSSLLE